MSPGAGPDPPDRDTWTGERRVTLDLDDATPLDLYRAWQTLADAGAYDLRARVSAGGEGFHVRGFVDADAVSESGVEALRHTAGDHPRRIEMDRTHANKPPQVLFSAKPKGKAGLWRETPEQAIRDLRIRSERYGLERWENATNQV